MKEDEFNVRPYIIEEFLLKHNKKLGSFDIRKSITLESVIQRNNGDQNKIDKFQLFNLFPEYSYLYNLSKTGNYSIGEIIVSLNLPLKTVLIMISNMVEMKILSVSGASRHGDNRFQQILDKKTIQDLIDNIKKL